MTLEREAASIRAEQLNYISEKRAQLQLEAVRHRGLA